MIAPKVCKPTQSPVKRTNLSQGHNYTVCYQIPRIIECGIQTCDVFHSIYMLAFKKPIKKILHLHVPIDQIFDCVFILELFSANL
jgi:hypothetical protein